MNNPQARELRYTVKLVPDTGPVEQALQRLGQQADQTAAKAKQVGAAVAGFGSPVHNAQGQFVGVTNPNGSFSPAAYGGGGGAGGGGGDAGGGGLGLVGKLAMTAAAVQTVANLVDATTKLGNEAMTAREKLLGFAGAIPVIGGALESILGNTLSLVEQAQVDGWFDRRGAGGMTVEALRKTFVTERGVGRMGAFGAPMASIMSMAEMDPADYPDLAKLGDWREMQKRLREAPFDQARRSARFRRDARLDDLTAADQFLGDRGAFGVDAVREMNALRFAPARISGLPAFMQPGGRFDDSDSYDAVIRAAYQNRVGARESFRLADSQLGQTQGQLSGMGERLEFLRGRSEWSAQVAAAEKAKADGSATHHARLQDTLVKAEADRAAYAQEAERYEQLIAKAKEQQLAAVQAESALRKANVGIAQAELQVVEAKIQKQKGGLEQFGMYDPAKQRAALEAMTRARDGGFESLTPEQKALLAGTGLTADFAAKRSRESVADADVTKALLAQLGDQDLKTLEGERERLRKKIKVDLEVDAEQLKKEVEDKVIGGLGDALRQAIGEAFRVVIRDIDLKQIQSNVSKK